MALGALPSSVTRLILRHRAGPTVVGVLLGVFG
jgi:hypothetical protein